MTSDPDIDTAKELLEQYGTAAGQHALGYACRALELGDTEGAAAWHRVVNAIERLMSG